VVASEVKGLANQTAKATEDIQAQVGAVQEQDATTREITRMVAQAANGTQSMSADVGEVSAAVRGAASAAAAVLGTADAVATRSHGLRTEIERFLDRLRSA
jgi:methyl-accepting chemotaxis protein